MACSGGFEYGMRRRTSVNKGETLLIFCCSRNVAPKDDSVNKDNSTCLNLKIGPLIDGNECMVVLPMG